MPMFHRRGKKEAKTEMELFLEKEDPSMALFDDDETNLQIIIPSNSVGDASAAASLQNERSRRRQLHENALSNKWNSTTQFDFDKLGDMVRVPLTTNGDTALHVAVSANNTTFVQKLVNLMTPRDLEITNTDGNTAYCVAAISGNGGLLDMMVKKNENLPLIRGQDGMLPVHLAALAGRHKIVRDMSSDQKLLDEMPHKDIERLFFITISSMMYDVARKLLEKSKSPVTLAIAKDDQELTALHMLAIKPSQEFNMKDDNNEEALPKSDDKKELLQKLWYHLRQLEYEKTLELITKPSEVLFDAVKSGNDDVVKLILRTNRELLAQKDSKGRSLLHIAILYRQISITDFMLTIRTSKLLVRVLDSDGNNVLHLAAQQLQEVSLSMKPSYSQMRKELAWFTEVKNRAPPELRTMRNREGKTPTDMFYANHQILLKDVKDEAKEIANSGMIVAALIAAVVFAAALTVPGDKANRWFDVFILTNAVALFTASASIIYFLAIFTSSWFRENNFFVSLLPRLNIRYALWLLCVSIVSMVIAFMAASFLIYGHKSKTVAYVVVIFGLLPICSLLPIQSTLTTRLYLASWSSL